MHIFIKALAIVETTRRTAKIRQGFRMTDEARRYSAVNGRQRHSNCAYSSGRGVIAIAACIASRNAAAVAGDTVTASRFTPY